MGLESGISAPSLKPCTLIPKKYHARCKQNVWATSVGGRAGFAEGAWDAR